MDRVTILESYIMESYKLYKVRPVGFIPLGVSKNMHCFDCTSLSEQWGISLDVLNKLVSYEASLKYCMYVQFTETDAGLVRTYMIDAKAVPSLLRKLKDSTYKPNTDISREHAVIAMLIDNARSYKNG